MAKKAFEAETDYLFLLNDDVIYGKGREAIERAIIETNYAYFINSGLWSCFLLSRECMQVFGPFDEDFYPAYYEDNDYARRLTNLERVGPITRGTGNLKLATFRHSMSIAKNPSLIKNSKNRGLFIKK